MEWLRKSNDITVVIYKVKSKSPLLIYTWPVAKYYYDSGDEYKGRSLHLSKRLWILMDMMVNNMYDSICCIMLRSYLRYFFFYNSVL